jgi:hypothetical protein
MSADRPQGTKLLPDGYYKVRIGIETRISPPSEPDDAVDSFEGDILFYRHETKRTRAGRFRVFHVRLGDSPSATSEIFDAHSSELVEYWDVLFDSKTDDLKQTIQDDYQVAQSDILILDTIEVLPIHRGRGLGLAVASRLIDVLGGGCGLVACKPFPLQLNPDSLADEEFRAKMQLDDFEQDEKAAFRRIRKHWGKLGFERVGRSPVFILSLTYCRPNIEDLCALDIL